MMDSKILFQCWDILEHFIGRLFEYVYLTCVVGKQLSPTILTSFIASLQSSCTIDVTYFPFDQQTCIMKFGSWTFTGDQVSLILYNNKDYVDLSDYWKSGTWDIIEVSLRF